MFSSEFLLLDKNKSYNINCKSYKNTNLVITPNGLSFWFWFWKFSKNQNLPGPRIEVAQPEKNPKMDTTKQIAIAIKQLLFFNDSPCVILTVSTKMSNKTGYKSSHSYWGIGKRVSRGAGLEFEIPVNFILKEMRIISWVKNSFEKAVNELHVKVKKCVK